MSATSTARKTSRKRSISFAATATFATTNTSTAAASSAASKFAAAPTTAGRRRVTVRPGYAIDCEGRDLVLDDPHPLDIVDMLSAVGSPPGAALRGEREVCLLVEADGSRNLRFRLEPPPPRKGDAFSEALQGALLLDFWRGCLKPLIDALRDLTDDASPQPGRRDKTSEFQKGTSAMTTLWAASIGGTPKAPIWISGSDDDSDPNSDHAVLNRLYRRLLAIAKTHASCGLLDDLQALP